MEGVIGEIRLFAGNFAPRSWAFCNGQLLAIATNTALFAILGVTYGGNGVNNFALPDLRGRVPEGSGNLPTVQLGELGGVESNMLTLQNMPTHTHTAKGTVNIGARSGKIASDTNPENNFYAQIPNGSNIFGTTTDAVMGSTVATVTVNNAGQSVPINNMQPYLGLNYIVCLQGIFPDRN